MAPQIKVSFTEDSVTFVEPKTSKSAVIRKDAHPEVFLHPRFIIADLKQAIVIFKPVIRSLSTWLTPRIEYSVDYAVAGGLTRIDRNIIEQTLVDAGAREAIYLEKK